MYEYTEIELSSSTNGSEKKLKGKWSILRKTKKEKQHSKTDGM